MMAKLTSPKEQATAAFQKLFKALDIRRVVIVDDIMFREASHEQVISRCIAMTAEGKLENLRSIPQLAALDESLPLDVNIDIIRKSIYSLDEKDIELISTKLADESDGQNDQESQTQSSLESILKHASKLITLNLKEWKDQSEKLLKECVDKKTIFLFDMDMSSEDGRKEEGFQIICDIVKNHQTLSPYCALISHTFEAGLEDAKESELIGIGKEAGITNLEDRLVVISKAYLQSDPLSFVCRVKRAAIAPKCAELKRLVAEVTQDAAAKATEEIAKLGIYDFEEIVFQSSHAEGVWEPETLFRIFNLFCRREMRSIALNNLEIKNAADEVRKFISIPFSSAASISNSSKLIRRVELYDEGQYLNSNHMPIELGDVFQHEDGDAFIVVAQPCDLMIRSNGERGRCREVPLLKIVKMDSKYDPSRSFELPYYQSPDFSSMVVRFSELITVNLDILDLSMFNEQGEAKFKINSVPPTRLIPSLQNRYKSISKHYDKICRTRETLTTKVDLTDAPELIGHLDHSLTGSNGVMKCTFDTNKGVSFRISRVLRLKPPYSASMLRMYSNYLSRDAHEHDVTRTKQNSHIASVH